MTVSSNYATARNGSPHRFISIRELARKAHVTDGFIYHLLNGKSGASEDTAARISVVLGVEVDTLFFRQGGQP